MYLIIIFTFSIEVEVNLQKIIFSMDILRMIWEYDAKVNR